MQSLNDPSVRAAGESSKSERKREAKRLLELGRALTKLNSRQIGQIPLTEELTNAINEHGRITSNEAKRRQLQFIGKLIRAADASAIKAAPDSVMGTSAQARFEMHQLERWRDRLMTDDNALTEYLQLYPATDRKLLKRLISKARADTGRAAPRTLFRFLRDHERLHTQDD